MSDGYLRLIAIGTPLLVIACGGFAKRLVRGQGWRASDWFLGVELSLSAIASGFIYLGDIARKIVQKTAPVPSGADLLAVAAFLPLCFFLLLLILSIHQEWERKSHSPWRQRFYLGVIANLIGFLLLAGFVVFVQGS